jgi:hypothetical protein
VTDWLRVSPARRCPVCEHADWCGVAADGALAVCMRVESARPTKNGGWLHVLRDDRPAWRPPPRPPVVRPAPLSSIPSLMSLWRARTCPTAYELLGRALGVAPAALAALGAGWAAPYRAWAFPMRDGAGATVGIRLRDESGRKWAVKGSREGLFYPESTPADHTAWVVEGPTDAAAGLTLGLWTVGRPSCTGAEAALGALFKRLAIHRAIIIADRDEPKTRPNGDQWRPGSSGAQRLAASLRVPTKTIFPAAKDLREWVRRGVVKSEVECIAGAFPWRRL